MAGLIFLLIAPMEDPKLYVKFMETIVDNGILEIAVADSFDPSGHKCRERLPIEKGPPTVI